MYVVIYVLFQIRPRANMSTENSKEDRPTWVVFIENWLYTHDYLVNTNLMRAKMSSFVHWWLSVTVVKGVGWFKFHLQDDVMLPERVRLQYESSLLHPKSVSSLSNILVYSQNVHCFDVNVLQAMNFRDFKNCKYHFCVITSFESKEKQFLN